ncbi:DNA repair protein, SNF2 family [Clavulina sp. PMI_390]|nr:DNA repair protein, SNF2 family [Clavulina sp. PMI_390]
MYFTKDPNKLNTSTSSETAAKTLLKPFKVPTIKRVERVLPPRKRKRVSYKNQDGGDDDDSDDEARKKRKRKDDRDALSDTANKAPLGKLELKEFSKIAKTPFTVPTMRAKDGTVIPVVMTGSALGIRPLAKITPRPLHDPMADHAIVLYDPTIDDRETDEERKERLLASAKEALLKEAEQKADNSKLYNPHKSLKQLLGLDDATKKAEDAKNKKVAVVIDPIIGGKLRPHQIEGVKFLYKAMTGQIQENYYGCIMADEMGLGKTMQCVAILWTLLRQSPRPGRPTIEKVIIACPASLVRNWQNEINKWLQANAVGYLTVDGKDSKEQLILNVRRWVAATGRGVSQPIMIVSYETLRNLAVELSGAKIGLLLCDEGHRLKNSENQTFTALNGLNVQRRVIITGTPIQNDLTEYFSLLNFANPGYLGSKADFRKNFELPIEKGRDADASEAKRAAGLKAQNELTEKVQRFIIRRTNDLLSKYLPLKYEHVVFCRASNLQRSLYDLFTSSPEIQKLLRGTGSQPLKAIDLLRKLCNTPQLLDLPSALLGSEDLLPEGFRGAAEGPGGGGGGSSSRRASAAAGLAARLVVHAEYSGKMAVLERFLHRIHHELKEKVVLISNFTQTLDLFESLCRARGWGFFRLDGTMPTAKRAKIVDQFNDPESPQFVFLLSSKAGGCGINLIGASRLVLFDPDWNPASDQQALARIWRDGQKRACFVYRFVCTGSIEEKIFQRQASKQLLSASMIDNTSANGGGDALSFSGQELRKLFLYKGHQTVCETHDTFKCKRCKNGKQVVKAQAMLYGDPSTWDHWNNADLKNNHDDLLRSECGGEDISFVFQYISH